MYIIELSHRQLGGQIRAYVHGRRPDPFFSDLLQEHPDMFELLLDDLRSPQGTIHKSLSKQGWPDSSYQLQELPGSAWRVVISNDWARSTRRDGAERLIDVGEYLLAGDYCVQIWSNDQTIRRRTACARIIDLLQYKDATVDLAPEDVRRRVDNVAQSLETSAPDVHVLLETASSRGLERAEHRLRCLLDVASNISQNETSAVASYQAGRTT